MAGSGFLKTVNFGGFDKKDVLAYVDELNTKIYNLETELAEKNSLLDGTAVSTSSFEGAEQYEKLISEDKSKINELMAGMDTLKLHLSTQESEISEKESELSLLKEKINDLEEKLETANSGAAAVADTSFDIGNVFIEAKHSADRIVLEAKNAAKRMEEDSRGLAQQVVDDANAKAEQIVIDAKKESENSLTTAHEKVNALVSNATSESEAMLSKASAETENMLASAKYESGAILQESNMAKQKIMSEFDELTADVEKLAVCLNDIIGDSVVKLIDAKGIIKKTQASIKDGTGFEFPQNLEELTNVFEKNGPIKKNKNRKDLNTTDDINSDEIDETENKPNFEPEYVVEDFSNSYEEIANSYEDDNGRGSKVALNIDLDLIAGLTAEIEAQAENNGVRLTSDEDPDTIYNSWPNQDGIIPTRISLTDDNE